MTVSPRDIQPPHYYFRGQSYGILLNQPNYIENYDIDYQLINIYQEVENRNKSKKTMKIFGK